MLWYEKLRTYCKNCKKYDALIREEKVFEEKNLFETREVKKHRTYCKFCGRNSGWIDVPWAVWEPKGEKIKVTTAKMSKEFTLKEFLK